jgi:NAD(P)-dependent dehydrogenase (short-subunit alcohol dehydrogenase family)
VTKKAVIITGAAGGLGRATSIAAAHAGYAVLAVDQNEAGLATTAQLITEAGGNAVTAIADVSRSDDVKAYVAKALDSFGRIDGFFNNAGILGRAGMMVDMDEAVFDRVVAINLKGVFLGLKYVLPVMLRQGSGSIVNTGSMTSTGGMPGLTGYGATKYGVISLTKTAALEVAKTGVRVNAVLPGNIKTKMALDSVPGVSEAEAEKIGASLVPQGRMGNPEDIAAAVIFLFSDGAKHITGIELPVDGGITAQVYPRAS